jgi:hypothetical protein
MYKVETRAPFQVAALAVLDHVVLESGTSEEIVSTFSNAGVARYLNLKISEMALVYCT